MSRASRESPATESRLSIVAVADSSFLNVTEVAVAGRDLSQARADCRETVPSREPARAAEMLRTWSIWNGTLPNGMSKNSSVVGCTEKPPPTHSGWP